MPANEYTRTPDVVTAPRRVIGFFKNKDDAYRAITQLKNNGFNSSEIGLIAGREYQTSTTGATQERDRESFWEKLKSFFTGESHEDIDYRDSVSGMDWGQNRADYYYRGITEGGALVSVTGTRMDDARRILQNAGGDLRESGFEAVATRGGAGVTQDYRIQLRGEILRTYKEPVTREELVVERVAPSGEQKSTGEIGTDEEVRVPLSEERARVEKKPVVSEEVRVGKRAVKDTERVSESVRHEELHVDKEGEVDVEADETPTGKRKKPAA